MSREIFERYQVSLEVMLNVSLETAANEEAEWTAGVVFEEREESEHKFFDLIVIYALIEAVDDYKVGGWAVDS